LTNKIDSKGTVDSADTFPVSKTALLAPTNFNLFLIFLKIGAILYGSGYLFCFFDAELVAKGLLTRTELIDAIAVGQFTPGPVFSSVTFVGYQINGISGHSFLRYFPHLCLLPY
jgi:chromate transporter